MTAPDFDDWEKRRNYRDNRTALPPSTQQEMDRNLNRCGDEECGQSRVTAGRPKRGWVKAGTPGNLHGERWWCSWDCLAAGARVLSLRGES